MSGIDHEDEIKLINDIIAGLEAALYETESDLGDNSDDEFRNARDIRVNKLVHRPIDDFGLPVLWSWFRYGQSIPRKQVMGWNVTPGPLEERTDSPTKAHTEIVQVARSPKQYRDYFIEDVGISDICDMNLDDFLEAVYGDAPDDYRALYLANLDIQRTLDEMYTSEDWLRSVSHFYDQVSESTKEFQQAILSNSVFDEELSSNANRYVRLLRNAIQSFDAQESVSENQVEQIDSLAKVYHKHVWRAIALKISSKTAEGPNSSYWSREWDDDSEEDASKTKQVLDELEEDLMEAGLAVEPQNFDDLPDDNLTTALRDIESQLLI